jgi:SAM-dependent methyltransferase
MRLALKDRSKTLSKFASPRHDIDNPIYNWYPFKHSYSKDLVNYLINEFNLKKGSWVLDPFCGGGTTLLACKEKGINAYGVDILPFSVFLSKTKTQEYDLKKINAIFKEFQNNHNLKDPELKLPDIPIVSKAFSKKVANELLSIKSFIYKIKGREKDLFNLGLLSISESVSNTSKSGGFLRIVNRKVNHTQVRRKFINRVKGFISALEKYQTNRNNISSLSQ